MKRGFALIELLAALSLIGILLSLPLPNVVQGGPDAEEEHSRDSLTLLPFDTDEDGAVDVDADGALVSVVMGEVPQSVSLADWGTGSQPERISK